MTDETNRPHDETIEPEQDRIMRVIENSVVRKLLEKGVSAETLANALLSHGATLLATVKGNVTTAEYLNNAAQALLDLEELQRAAPPERKH